MAITSEINRTDELTTDGVVEDYDFPMHIHHKSEVKVWYKPDGGRYNSLLLDTNYGVVFTEDGGTVSTDGYSAPLPAGKLLIIRHIEITQHTNWLYNDNHTGQTHQDDFDRSVMRDLQIQEQLDRCVGFAIHSITRDITFPEPKVGYLVGWNAAGDDLTNISPPTAAEDIPEVLNDLDDVIIAAPVNGDLLRYDGTHFTNDVAGAITGTSFIIGGNTLDTNEWSNLDGLNQSLATGDNVVFNNITGAVITGTSLVAGTLTLGTLTLVGASITDSSGAISFGNENLVTSADIKAITHSIIDSETPAYVLRLQAENTGITADRALTFNVGNVNRILKLSGNPTLGDWFNQNVKTNAIVVFDQVIIEDATKSLIDVNANNDLIIENKTSTKDIILTANNGSVIVDSLIGVTGDDDLLQLAANALTVNGTITSGNVDVTGTIIASSHIQTDGNLKVKDTLSAYYLSIKPFGAPLTADRLLVIDMNNAGRVLTLQGNVTLDQDVHVAASPVWTGTVDISTGKIRIRDDNSSKPSAEGDGYISVYKDGATQRIYTFINGQRYYVNLTADPIAVPVVGNPIGLLLALTYAA